METDISPIMKKRRIRIERPAHDDKHDKAVWDEVRKYASRISDEPDPNLGQVREIKNEIKKGTYLQPEMIDETAARLAARFLRKM